MLQASLSQESGIRSSSSALMRAFARLLSRSGNTHFSATDASITSATRQAPGFSVRVAARASLVSWSSSAAEEEPRPPVRRRNSARRSAAAARAKDWRLPVRTCRRISRCSASALRPCSAARIRRARTTSSPRLLRQERRQRAAVGQQAEQLAQSGRRVAGPPQRRRPGAQGRRLLFRRTQRHQAGA